MWPEEQNCMLFLFVESPTYAIESSHRSGLSSSKKFCTLIIPFELLLIMKNFYLLILFLPILALAQTKALLLTIPEDEYVDSDNTKIISTATGADYIVMTYDDYQKYFKYTKTEKRKPFAVDIWEDEVIISGKENGLKYFKAKSTGVKYGPYTEISALYNLEKKVLYGYSYFQDGKSYFFDLLNKKKYGPFEGGGLWYMDDKNLVYSYSENTTTGKAVYLIDNGNKLGPYEQVSYRRAETGKASPIIIYKKSNQYYVNQDPWKSVGFASYPSFATLQNGWAIEGTEVAGSKDKWIFLPNGKKVENFEKVKHSVNSKQQALRMDYVAGGGSDAAYKVTYEGKEIGTFAIKKSMRSDIVLNDFFDHLFTKVEIRQNNWSLAYRDVNYFFSPTHGLVGPFTAADVSKTYFIADGYATITADSTLNINGKMALDNVIAPDFSQYPDTWWALQQKGDYAYPFKNGIEASLGELPVKLRHFHTIDKPVVKVRRPNNTYFLLITSTKKLLGPVSQYSESLTSNDYKHYIAVADESQNVVVDGKVVGRFGFNLTYNDKLHAFHWLATTGQQLFLYSYKLPK